MPPRVVASRFIPSINFAERAKAAGTKLTLEAYPGCSNDFQVMASLVSEGLVAVERLVGFLARVLGRARAARGDGVAPGR